MNPRIVSGMAFLCILSEAVFSITITNPAYQVETYLRYDTENLGRCVDFTFDDTGALYVAHTSDGAQSGSIQKISPDKNVTTLCSGLVDPRQIVWGGGTSFGSNLYVTDRLKSSNSYLGEVTKINLAGSRSFFAGGLDQPESLMIDRTGSYSQRMYISNSAADRISRVSATGGTVSTFSGYPYNITGTIYGLEADTTGTYGNKMFAGTTSSVIQYAGLFQIDTNGAATRYADLRQAGCIAFDDTAKQYFDGKMFVAGKMTSSDVQWSLFMVNGYDDIESVGVFDVGTSWARVDFEFGADGALYVMEWDSVNQDALITRITPIPEPTSALLLGLGCFLARRFSRA